MIHNVTCICIKARLVSRSSVMLAGMYVHVFSLRKVLALCSHSQDVTWSVHSRTEIFGYITLSHTLIAFAQLSGVILTCFPSNLLFHLASSISISSAEGKSS